KESLQLFDDLLPLFPITPRGGKPGYWFHNPGYFNAIRCDSAVTKCPLDEVGSFFGTKVFFLDNVLKFHVLLTNNELPPFFLNLTTSRNRVDESLDEVALVTQAWAGINGTGNLCTDFFIFTVTARLTVFFNQHEDVVNVNLSLFDQLDLKYHIIVDGFLICNPIVFELCIILEVDAAVVLVLALAKDFITSELIE